MNATGKRRLLKLADFLDELPKSKKFEMRWWADDITDDGRPACGTSACAAGWAACIPSFRRAGYKLSREWIGPTPSFQGRIGDGAIEKFFDIGVGAVRTLFGSHNPNSPKAAARRIRKLVASSKARAA